MAAARRLTAGWRIRLGATKLAPSAYGRFIQWGHRLCLPWPVPSPPPVCSPAHCSLCRTPAGPKYVEWINDSSANVLFADGPTAKRAVAGMGKPLPPEEAPEQMGAHFLWMPSVFNQLGAACWASRCCPLWPEGAHDLSLAGVHSSEEVWHMFGKCCSQEQQQVAAIAPNVCLGVAACSCCTAPHRLCPTLLVPHPPAQVSTPLTLRPLSFCGTRGRTLSR